MKSALNARYLCSELVRVEWRNDAGDAKASAILEEIWREGACLQTLTQLRVGIRVWIVARNVMFLGSLTECKFAIDGYYSRVRFDEDSRWSTRIYKPEHMLNTRAVLTRWLRRHLANRKAPRARTAGRGAS